MCGRFTQTKLIREYVTQLSSDWSGEITESRNPTWNLAPSALSSAIREIEGHLTPSLLKWGFSKDEGKPGPAPINARVETAPVKYPFKESWKEKRCLVPADGWYEWRTEAGSKQPFYFTRTDQQPIFFAGIWTANTFALFTTAADGELAIVHDRKPLSLEKKDALKWIGEGMATAEELVAVSVKAPAFKLYPVSKAVSNWRNNGPELTTPLCSTKITP